LTDFTYEITRESGFISILRHLIFHIPLQLFSDFT